MGFLFAKLQPLGCRNIQYADPADKVWPSELNMNTVKNSLLHGVHHELSGNCNIAIDPGLAFARDLGLVERLGGVEQADHPTLPLPS